MIVCTKCGFENEDSDTFCGSCAGFLEWSGQKVQEPEPAPEPEPELEPEEAHQGFIDRVKDRIGMGEKDEDAAADDVPAAAASNGAEGSEAPAAVVSEPAPPSTPSAPAAVATAATASPAPPPVSAPPVSAPPVSAPPVSAPPVSTPAAPSVSAPAAAAASAPTAAAATAAPPVAGEAAAGPPASTAPPVAPTAVAATAATAAAATATTTKTEPVQPAAVQPSAVQPQAVKPQAVKARPTPKQKQPSTREVNPGDLVCGQCGEGNDPKRKFCRRCGASLQEAVVFVLPWYQRWWQALTRKKVRAAGDRPKNRRRLVGGSGPGIIWGILRIVLVIAVIVVVILALTSHGFRHRVNRYYHDVVGVVHPSYTPVHPSSASANSEQVGFPPSATIDGAINSHWATAPVNNGIGATLTLRMATPTDIDKFGILNGNQDSSTSFLTEPVPKDVRVVFAEIVPEKNAEGRTVNKVETAVKNYTLKDVPNFQTFTESYKGVSVFELTILSVYPPSNGNGRNASIAEVEFFKKS
jgi:hypothetical protein